MFTTSAPRITVRFVALLTAVSLVLSAFPAAFFVANAEETVPPVETPAIDAPVVEEKVTVCHSAGQSGNYTAIEVAVSAVVGAHGDHDSDIIPPFGDFIGQNWGEDTQAIWSNNCATPEPDDEDVTPPTEACEIEGHKYDAAGNPLSGWTIGLMNTISHNLGIDQYDVATTETDSDGYYCLEWDGVSRELRPGTVSSYVDGAYSFIYSVFEDLKDGWKNISIKMGPDSENLVAANEEDITTDATRTSVKIGDTDGYVYANVAYHVDFYNELNNDDEPEPTYTVDGYKFSCVEDGDWYCNTPVEDWMITATDGDNVATTTTNEDGYYSFKLPAGDWTISEEDRLNWEQIAVWQNGEELNETSVCTFDLGAIVSMDTVKALDYTPENTCDFGNVEFDGPLYTLSGYKWNDLDADGLWDEGESALSDWTISVTNGSTTDTTITDEDGFYLFLVPTGDWTVSEVAKSGWTQTGTLKNDEPVESLTCSFNVDNFESSTVSSLSRLNSERLALYNYSCDFGNHQDEVITEEEPEEPAKKGSRSSGTRTRAPQGQVLGASTQCGLWLEDYMQKATENDTYQVLKLQVFLTLQGYATPLTGIFDATTEANVKLFQAKYADTVIKPWFDKGIVPHNRPTGFVYKTTRWQINDIMCPNIEPYPSLEGENLSTNVLINR